MATLKLYVDHLSQPCRSCMLFCRVNGLPMEEVLVNLGKGEHMQPPFRAINPLGKVPCLQDGDFVLPESAAILRYLATTQGTPDHWYPACPKARAQVDSALDWHHGNLRLGARLVVWNRAILALRGQPSDEGIVTRLGLPTLRASLQALEAYWLGGGSRRFVGGGEAASVADLLMACELEQLALLDRSEKVLSATPHSLRPFRACAQGPPMAQLLAPHPGVRAWLARVTEACGPHYGGVHAVLWKVAGRVPAALPATRL